MRTNEHPRIPRLFRAGVAIAVMGLASGLAVTWLAPARAAEGDPPDAEAQPDTRTEDLRRASSDAREDGADAATGAAQDRGGTPPAPLVYIPPSRGAAGARVGGATRGREGLPRISVVAPDHVGLTWRSRPILVWHLSEPVAQRVDFTLIAEDAIEPLVERTLPGPLAAGFHTLDLSDDGVTLEPGATYVWSIVLVPDPASRDRDRFTSGLVRRELRPPDLPADASYPLLARGGAWYDALADLTAAIAARPADARLRADRAALLSQVGLVALVGNGPDASGDPGGPAGGPAGSGDPEGASDAVSR